MVGGSSAALRLAPASTVRNHASRSEAIFMFPLAKRQRCLQTILNNEARRKKAQSHSIEARCSKCCCASFHLTQTKVERNGARPWRRCRISSKSAAAPRGRLLQAHVSLLCPFDSIATSLFHMPLQLLQRRRCLHSPRPPQVLQRHHLRALAVSSQQTSPHQQRRNVAPLYRTFA